MPMIYDAESGTWKSVLPSPPADLVPPPPPPPPPLPTVHRPAFSRSAWRRGLEPSRPRYVAGLPRSIIVIAAVGLTMVLSFGLKPVIAFGAAAVACVLAARYMR